MANDDVPQLVDHLFHHQAGQLIATLTRIFGPQNLELAEDVLQETLVKALQQWSYHGVPNNPRAWLLRVARNHALDLLRREQRLHYDETIFERQVDPQGELAIEVLENELYDDQLRMIFTCCHPALSREVQVTLTLKTLGGFGVAEIARAFLSSEATIAQRLVRAKRTLREQQIPFAVPEKHELPARLHAVLDVLYLLFNEGYSASQGEQLTANDLCTEAIRLVALLAAHQLGDQPQVHALHALMLLQASRLPTRIDAFGELVLLEEQDRSCWDHGLILRGLQALSRSASGSQLSSYHLQAGIAACHATAASYAATDWQRIVAQYDALIALDSSPVIALNRAVAIAMVHGPAAGLLELDKLALLPLMRSYTLFHATYGALSQRQGDLAQAIVSYRAALECTGNGAERRFLERQIAHCQA
jgi:RNA polymerase sigma factor (sigma-70 family)